jgi:hypothetical protein
MRKQLTEMMMNWGYVDMPLQRLLVIMRCSKMDISPSHRRADQLCHMLSLAACSSDCISRTISDMFKAVLLDKRNANAPPICTTLSGSIVVQRGLIHHESWQRTLDAGYPKRFRNDMLQQHYGVGPKWSLNPNSRPRVSACFARGQL